MAQKPRQSVLGIHTPEEYAEVESVVPRLDLLSRMLMDLSSAN